MAKPRKNFLTIVRDNTVFDYVFIIIFTQFLVLLTDDADLAFTLSGYISAAFGLIPAMLLTVYLRIKYPKSKEGKNES